MEKDFIVYQLKSIAIATQEINNAISVLIGYLKQDDHDIAYLINAARNL